VEAHSAAADQAIIATMAFANSAFIKEAGEEFQAAGNKLDTKFQEAGDATNDTTRKVGIIGSGDFGRALAGRLAQTGYAPVIGSRNPNEKRELVGKDVVMGTYSEACQADIIIIAIPQAHYGQLPADLLFGKTLVDVSNRGNAKPDNESQAEYLAKLYPNSKVVKGFNVLSAYSLESGAVQGSKQVYIAGDCLEAKNNVAELVRGIGFTPVDLGALTAARVIEDIPMSMFPSWRKAFLVHAVLFAVLYTIGFLKYQVCWPLTWSDNFLWALWNHIPMDTFNKTLATHSLISLSLCYLPGVLAAWLQIFRGTKYSRFPNWLDQWLRMRKQLGLLMLLTASLHACISVMTFSPTYQELAHRPPKEALISLLVEGADHDEKILLPNSTVTLYGTEKLDWRGESFVVTGVLGFGLVVLLGISSLPSVSQTLSWREFTFIQSGLGWTSIVLLCLHDILYGWKYLNSPSCGIPSSFQYALYIPGLAIVMKIPVMLPPLSSLLSRIRQGYVRGQKSPSAA